MEQKKRLLCHFNALQELRSDVIAQELKNEGRGSDDPSAPNFPFLFLALHDFNMIFSGLTIITGTTTTIIRSCSLFDFFR